MAANVSPFDCLQILKQRNNNLKEEITAIVCENWLKTLKFKW